MLQRLWYGSLRLLCQVGFSLWAGIRVTGRNHMPTAGGCLIVSSHQSYLDPLLLGLGIPRQLHFMARETLFHNATWFSRLMRSLNAFPVRQGEPDLGAIKETIRRVRAGAAVVIFPEGKRTEDGSIGILLPGAVMLARKCGVPVVPAVITGAYELWPRQQRLPSLRGRIRVAFGRPFAPAEVAGLAPEELTRRIRERMLQLHAGLTGASAAAPSPVGAAPAPAAA